MLVSSHSLTQRGCLRLILCHWECGAETENEEGMVETGGGEAALVHVSVTNHGHLHGVERSGAAGSLRRSRPPTQTCCDWEKGSERV